MRFVSSSLSACLVAVVSCSGPAADGKKPPPRTNIITGSTGSTWYTIGSGLAEKANVFFDGHPITAVPGAGGVSNPVRAAMTGVDLGISYGPFLRAAYRGEAPFREALPQLRVVATLVLNTLHVLSSPELEMKSRLAIYRSHSVPVSDKNGLFFFHRKERAFVEVSERGPLRNDVHVPERQRIERARVDGRALNGHSASYSPQA